MNSLKPRIILPVKLKLSCLLLLIINWVYCVYAYMYIKVYTINDLYMYMHMYIFSQCNGLVVLFIIYSRAHIYACIWIKFMIDKENERSDGKQHRGFYFRESIE